MRKSAAVYALALSLLISFVPRALAGAGYREDHIDADDLAGRNDIRSATLRVFLNEEGTRRVLAITVHTYEPLGLQGAWTIVAYLDYRRGDRWDANISFNNIEGPTYCSLNYRSGGGWSNGASQEGRRVTCRFFLKRLRPEKHIRWRLVAEGRDGPQDDRAPDRGWYS